MINATDDLISPEDAIAVIDLYAAQPHTYDWDYCRRFVACTRIIPDWLCDLIIRRNAWIVEHAGKRYNTIALSDKEAINKVRYRLYGATPEAALPPFSAFLRADIIRGQIAAARQAAQRNVAPTPSILAAKPHKTISQDDLLRRLKSMTA